MLRGQGQTTPDLAIVVSFAVLFVRFRINHRRASVYNVKAKNWIAPSEPVDNIEQGKERAAQHAKAYLQHAVNSELPPLEWKKSRTR